MTGKKPPALSFETDFTWRRTIFCESADIALKAVLDRCAAELGCRIWYNEDTAPDILAVGSFIHIVDRRLLGGETWQFYVRCCNGSRDAIPCILVDHLTGLPLPKTKPVLRLDLGRPDSIGLLTDIIHDLKRRMDENTPIVHRKLQLPSVQKRIFKDDGGVLIKFDWK